jgi:diguanylate cyclase (GGDEF)-like protein/PAS domain S-box-containing protein
MTGDRSDSGMTGDRLAAVGAVGGVLAGSASLPEAAPKVLEIVCQHLGWDVGLLSLVDASTNALHRIGSWHRPGIQLPGDEELPGASAAALAGFFGTIGFPIRAGNDVLGTIELYSREARRPDDDVLAVLENVGGQIASYLKRKDEDTVPEEGTRYRSLIEGLPAVSYICVADEGMRSLYVSPQIKSLLGITASEWREDPTIRATHLHPQDRDRVLAEYKRARDTGKPVQIEYRMTAADGSTVWIREAAVASHDAHGHPTVIQGLMVDVTEQRQGEFDSAYRAYHDELTGLPNRDMFEEMLGQVLERAARHHLAVSVLVLDIDDFNLVNTSLGQEAGDEMLRQVAARLRESAEEADLVARQSGDEFLLLLAGHQRSASQSLRSSAEVALLVAEAEASRIQDALQAPFVLSDMEFYVTASIGISVYPLDAESRAEMLDHAENAMRRSKKAGPGGFVLYSKQAEDPVRGLSFTTRLRKAVERHDWVLHYHPIMALEHRQIVGVEALLRWQDSNGKLLSPGEFIEAAEDMGLIESVGDWVLEEIGRQLRAWRDQGIELDASINLSPRQLWQPNLVARTASHLQASGVDPETVVIEVAESAAAADPERTRRVLQNLREQGLRLAIDDFGTSVSSIARLKDLPVDILKVDSSFVRKLPGDTQAARMARAIIQLGHSLGMVPLAEGIDSEDQREFLVRHGCPLGQGYLFGKPMSAERITELCLSDEMAGAEEDLEDARDERRDIPRDDRRDDDPAVGDDIEVSDPASQGLDALPGLFSAGPDVDLDLAFGRDPAARQDDSPPSGRDHGKRRRDDDAAPGA